MSLERIRQYWDDRAANSAGERNATTDDIHLRDLEVAAITAMLRSANVAKVLDVGCGDGDTTLRIAAGLPNASVRAVDYSKNMIAIAKQRLASSELSKRVQFDVADATKLVDYCCDARFDAVITCRTLINLPDRATQFDVLQQIAQVLALGGTYVGTENFVDGQDNMNSARAHMGLAPISIRWHNLYFERDPLLDELARHFVEARIDDFASSYYFATRVLYSAMCKDAGVQPDYDHEIHRIAPKLPPMGRFSPVQLIVARRGDAENQGMTNG